MKKGFVTIIVLFAVLTLAIIISTNTVDYKNESYHTPIFLETKNKISNYSILINQAAQNCFLESEIKECIDSNSDLILEKLNLTKAPFYCENVNFEASGSNTYLGTLNCDSKLYSNNKIVFSNQFFVEIKVNKIPTN